LSIVFGGHFCYLERKIPGTCADIEDGSAIGLGDFIRANLYFYYLKMLGWVRFSRVVWLSSFFHQVTICYAII